MPTPTSKSSPEAPLKKTVQRKSKGTQVASQKDVAARANISQAAVSVVLSGRTDGNITVSPALRQRILDAADELNYRPNLSARAMRQKKVFHVGYFVATSDQTDFDFAAFRAGVYDAANENDFHVVLVRLPNPVAMQIDSVPRIFQSHNLAGMVINEINPLPDDVRATLRKLRDPIVYLNNRYPSNCVCVDDRLGASFAMNHLVSQGFRKIAFLQNHPHPTFIVHDSVNDRRSVYGEIMRANNLKEVYVDYPREDGTPVREILRSKDRPEAFCCYDDHAAMDVQKYLYEAKLEIGKEVALVGYNEDFFIPLSMVPLTTVKIPRYDMAVAAMRMCISLINGNRKEVPPVVFKPTLIIRQSSLRDNSVRIATGKSS